MRGINYSSFALVYEELVNRLLNGRSEVSRGMKHYEIPGLTIRVDDSYGNVLYHPDRHLNYRFMVAEWLWIWFGHSDVSTIAQYNSKIAQFSDDGQTLAGAYGPPFKVNLAYALDRLYKDLYTRQAIIQIWQTPWNETKDVPCTLTLQFLVRDGRLNTIVNMRSSDVWLGLPYDFFNFTMLANCVASYFNLPLGWTQLNLGSSHLYDVNYSELYNLNSAKWEVINSPRLVVDPPANLDYSLMHGKHSISMREPWERYSRIFDKIFVQTPLAVLRELSADQSKLCDIDPEAGKI